MEFKAPEHMTFTGKSGTNLSESWKKWQRQFEYYFDAAEVEKKAKKTQVATLLHSIGPEVRTFMQNRSGRREKTRKTTSMRSRLLKHRIDSGQETNEKANLSTLG